MTYEQAEHAARMRHPVVYRGIQYMRIEEVGRGYPVRGGETAFVTLKDRNRNSTIRVRPEEVELVGAIGEVVQT